MQVHKRIYKREMEVFQLISFIYRNFLEKLPFGWIVEKPKIIRDVCKIFDVKISIKIIFQITTKLIILIYWLGGNFQHGDPVIKNIQKERITFNLIEEFSVLKAAWNINSLWVIFIHRQPNGKLSFEREKITKNQKYYTFLKKNQQYF